MPMVWATYFVFRVYQYLYEQIVKAYAILFKRQSLKIENLIDRGAALVVTKDRPKAHPSQTIIEAYQIMKESDNDYLPVYLNNEFVGTISLITITGRLIEVLNETKQYCQSEIIEIRSSLTNIQGLTNLIHDSNTTEETQEIIQLANTCCNKAMAIMENLLNVEKG